MPSWRRVFTSEEAFVESKAGASPPEPRPKNWLQVEFDRAHEEITREARYKAALEEIVSRHPRDLWSEHPACLIAAAALGDSPPDAVVEDARLLVDEVEAAESFLRAGPGNPYGKRDWPQPSPPPFPADDEDDEAPDE